MAGNTGSTVDRSAYEDMGHPSRLFDVWRKGGVEGPYLFGCPFTFTVWNRLAGRLCGRWINPDWTLTLQFVTRNTLSSLDKVLLQMLFQTCIYYMWKERNDRRHQNGNHSKKQVIRTIDKAIRNRISSLRYKYDHKLAGLMQRWFEVSDYA